MTSCASSHADAGGGSAPWVGYTWRIVEVQHGTTSTSIPAALNGFVAFAPDRTLSANDGVNFYSGIYVVDGNGYRPNNAGATLAGYVGKDPVQLALIAAVRALTGSDAVATASNATDNLQLAVDGYTVTCIEQGVARNELPPSPTPTRS
jgi:hypothetical protein